MAVVLSFTSIVIIACLSLVAVESKLFERCELAQVLHERHRLDLTEVAQWVCIAQHSSGFNTAAHAKSAAGGSHGLFQISDVYWCSPPGKGTGCNLPCQKLRDDDLSDDLNCVKRIYDEHQRISGDGYTAWNAYQQYCQHKAHSYIQDCFSVEPKRSSKFSPANGYNTNRGQFAGNAIEDYSSKKTGKVYERCELARELYNRHKMSMQQIPTWVCIAEYESGFNTAAVGRLNADGSADHGLFQISDLYWCSHDRFNGGGKACGLPCSKLLDNDITDDVDCIKRIHTEHTEISGDGFNAWTVYQPYCQNKRIDTIANCFKNIHRGQPKAEIYGYEVASNQIPTTIEFNPNKNNPFLKHLPPVSNDISKTPPYLPRNRGASGKGKVYTRCTLAQELYYKHGFSIQDTSIWVCIAEHESQFNTAARGQLNTDGSVDHGIFHINDRYWCDHSVYGGKGCDVSCNKLLDEDLYDDVACIKTIHEEHTRISGDGFNAWAVYKPHCRNIEKNHIKDCFTETELKKVNVASKSIATNSIEPAYSSSIKNTRRGKIYKKCELARELVAKHRMPMEQIPTWVCIAQHESSLNTAAIGRLNTDGSLDHGLFQISDLYWCSHDEYGGKACNMPCDKLLDSDLTDDIECVKVIYEEHTRISGDGFNAWTVYKPHCRNSKIEEVSSCFSPNQIEEFENHNFWRKDKSLSLHPVSPIDSDSQNSFSNHQQKPLNTKDKHKYSSNPFLKNIKVNSNTSGEHVPNSFKNNKEIHHKHTPSTENYHQNPFLRGLSQTSSGTQKHQQYQKSTKLNSLTDHSVSKVNNTIKLKPTELLSEVRSYPNNPFLSHIPLAEAANTPTHFSLHGHPSSLEKHKNYLNSNGFRTTTTSKPRITAAAIPTTSSTIMSNAKDKTITVQKTTMRTTEKLTSRRPIDIRNSTTQITSKRPTTEQTVTHSFTTKSTKTTTTRSELQQRTTTKPPRTTTSSQEQYRERQNLTKSKPTTAATAKQTQNLKYTNKKVPAQSTSNFDVIKGQTITSSRTTIGQRDKPTTTKPPSSTENWRKWDKTTTKTSSHTTAKASATTTSLRNKQNRTTTKPGTATENWRKWDKTTTKTPRHKPTTKTGTLTSRLRDEQKPTTTKPATTIENWRKWDTTSSHTTTKASTSNARLSSEHKFPITKPVTTTENWRKWDKPTTKTPSHTTTKASATTTNLRNKEKLTTTKPGTTTENWRKWDKTTTKAPSHTTTKRASTRLRNENSPATMKPGTTTENWRKWDKTTTKAPSHTTTKTASTTITRLRNEQKHTTTKPGTTTENWRKWDKTTTKTPSHTTTRKASTTMKPVTTTENWRKWDKTTTRKPSHN